MKYRSEKTVWTLLMSFFKPSMYLCLYVCMSVQAVTFVYKCILTISRSILNIKVTGSRSRSYFAHTLPNFYFYMLVFHQGCSNNQGHLEVKIKVKWKEINFLSILNVSVTYVLC